MENGTSPEEIYVGGVPCFTWMLHRFKHVPKNKKKRHLTYQIQMVIFTYVIYSLFNMARRPFAVVKMRIIEEYNTSLAAGSINSSWVTVINPIGESGLFFGLMDFVFVFSYGLCLYASGIIADCYNPRFYLTAGCFLSGYFCALLGLTEYWHIYSYRYLVTIFILFGLSQSTAWPVVLSSVTHWYGVVGKRRGMFFGFWNTHNYLGSMLGILLASHWVDSSWMWSFFVPGFILLFAGALVFLYMVVDPKDIKELDKIETSSQDRIASKRQVPSWLDSKFSLTMYEALTLPGVLEFSSCMFFSRMVGSIFLFWLPVFMQTGEGVKGSTAAYYSLAYVLGGSIGGVIAGIIVDITRRTALVCAAFLVLSIPVLLFGLISKAGINLSADFPLFLVTGLFVEAPYVVISTSVSVDLGTHKLVKRNYRALSTIGGIIEGTGAIGASIGTFVCGIIMVQSQWRVILYMMVGCQLLAILCLGRQAYKDFYGEQKQEAIMEYLKLPSFT